MRRQRRRSCRRTTRKLSCEPPLSAAVFVCPGGQMADNAVSQTSCAPRCSSPPFGCTVNVTRDDADVKEILQDIDRWQRDGERFALATVVATRRSAPRPPGAKLGVSSGGELAGSVSGGCVENEVYGVAQEVLGGAKPRLLTYGISDDLALEVGLPCGGEIDVFVEEADQELVNRLRGVIEDQKRAV